MYFHNIPEEYCLSQGRTFVLYFGTSNIIAFRHNEYTQHVYRNTDNLLSIVAPTIMMGFPNVLSKLPISPPPISVVMVNAKSNVLKFPVIVLHVLIVAAT